MTTRQAELMEPIAQPKAAPPSDEELLERIARSNDRQAFEDLAYRYSRLAYNLALHLCGNAVLAEDAAQDALVDVWLRARHYDPARGRPRSWILCIVANKTLTLRTRESREKKRVQVKRAETRIEAEAPPEHPAESGDLSAALQQTMTRLSEAERQIVSMYYGAELTQDEIARSLDMSQRTVSLRLQQSLEKLRRDLSAAGFAAALPLLEAGKLGDALLGAEAAPPGLHASIMRALASGASQSTRMAAAGKPWVFWLTGALLLSAAAGGGWWAFQPGAIQPEPAGAPDALPMASGVDGHGAKVAMPQQWTWAFDGPNEAQAFAVMDGSWNWTASKGDRERPGAMRVTESVRVAISADLSDGSYLLAFDIANVSTQGMSAGAFWEQEGPAVTVTNLSNAPRPAEPVWLPVRIYLTGEFRVAMMQDEVRHIVFARRAPDARMAISLVGSLLVDNISVRRIPDSEIPDIQHYRALVDGIPAAEHNGTVKRLLGEGRARQRLQVTFPPKPTDRKD